MATPELREYRAAYQALLDAEARGTSLETQHIRRVDLLGAWGRAREMGATRVELMDIQDEVWYQGGY